MNQASPPELADRRREARGASRILLVVVATFTFIFVWMAIVRATSAFIDHHPLIASLTIVSALTWVAATIGLFHNGRKMRKVALGTSLVNAIMPIIAALISDFPVDRWSPWYNGGHTYWYVPGVLAFAVIVWLYYSSPARLAQHNG